MEAVGGAGVVPAHDAHPPGRDPGLPGHVPRQGGEQDGGLRGRLCRAGKGEGIGVVEVVVAAADQGRAGHLAGAEGHLLERVGLLTLVPVEGIVVDDGFSDLEAEGGLPQPPEGGFSLFQPRLRNLRLKGRALLHRRCAWHESPPRFKHHSQCLSPQTAPIKYPPL